MRHALNHRHAEYRTCMTVVLVLATLAVLGSVLPAVEHATNVLVLGTLGLALLVALARLGARWVRERIEDAADARTAAAWRARHAPHLLASSAPVQPTSTRQPAGVA